MVAMRESFIAKVFAPAAVPLSNRRAAASALAVVCLLALAGCGEEPRYAKSAATNSAPAATPAAPAPRDQMAPRADANAQPVASSHGASAARGVPGWTMLSGQRESLADNRGKVLIIDLYATYCGPCIQEIPHLNELQSRHQKQGLRVVGLNVGGEDDRLLVPDFVREHGIRYELGNPDDAFVDYLSGGDTSIPRTYVFDRQGRLVDYTVGFGPSVVTQLQEAVQAALGTKQ
jgi:thiol-disulfide isomerase/thioredoxin